MTVHYNIYVYGKVQGVGFRYSAQTIARQYALKGFVKNLVNGSVYIEIEGTAQNCAGFIEWCKKGPGYGRIDEVRVSESANAGHEEFSIRR